jgi:hypothetical protein
MEPLRIIYLGRFRMHAPGPLRISPIKAGALPSQALSAGGPQGPLGEGVPLNG